MLPDTTNKITLDQFLAQLRALETEWHLDDEGRIRTRIGARVCCPITALGTQKAMFKYRLDAQAIGLPYSLAVQIAYASDGVYKAPFEHELRGKLLRATILKLSQEDYRAGISACLTLKEAHAFFALWGGDFESFGVLRTPWGERVDVLVSKWGVL